MRGIFLGWFVGLVAPVQTFVLPLLHLSSQNIISSPHTFLLYQFPSPSNLGRQSCQVACLRVSDRNTGMAKAPISSSIKMPCYAYPQISFLPLYSSLHALPVTGFFLSRNLLIIFLTLLLLQREAKRGTEHRLSSYFLSSEVFGFCRLTINSSVYSHTYPSTDQL